MAFESAGVLDTAESGSATVFYRDQLGGTLIAVGMTPLALVLIVGTAAAIPLLERFVCGLLLAAPIVATARTVRRFGIGISRLGLDVRGTSARRTIPWTDVAAFRSRPWFRYAWVQVELRSGKLVRTPMIQGRKMVGNGGATRDILGVLNAHLAEIQSGERPYSTVAKRSHHATAFAGFRLRSAVGRRAKRHSTLPARIALATCAGASVWRC
jgi:hypothetical protein